MTNPDTDRQRWMGLLAQAQPDALERWSGQAQLPAFDWLRRPETGLVMVRARTGGTGERFNLGEMTITRCVVRTCEGATGVAYVAGRSHRHAELAALADALLQSPDTRSRVQQALLEPLAAMDAERQASRRRKAEATRVEFFTLARAEA